MSYQTRNDIPTQYKWNLADIFVSTEAWDKEFEQILALLPTFTEYKGKLNNKKTILEMYKNNDITEERIEKLYCYAYMTYCEDSKNTDSQTRYGKVSTLLSKMSELLAYVEPEMSKIPDQELNEMVADKDFADYSESLKALIRNKPHVLSEEQERIVASTGDVTRFFNETFSRLDSGDLDYGSIMVDGKEVKLSHGAYSTLMQHPDQNVRKLAFERYYKAYIDQVNTISAIYEGSVKSDIFYAKVRKFDSAMEKATFYENADKVVYENLIKSINNSFEPLHEYIALRKKLLKVDKLNMYDLHVPIFANADIAVDYEKAFDMVLEGLAPLGEDYRKLLLTARNNRWVDVYETPTKRGGAYSMGVTGVHPFVMLNYQETTHDIFTLAHELGHSMHSHYSSKNQPQAKAGYTIFVAEVASTVNEVLLLNYLLAKEKDVNIKKYLLSYYLDMLRTTMYRQAMFAEFEYIAHKRSENGEPLSSEVLSNDYYELNKKYYGPSVEHNQQIRYEWARIPHFYRAFYVYKYSTGITSAVCIAQRILKEGAPMVAKYKQFLSLGCSLDPVSELKVAGVDLTSNVPFDIVKQSFAETLQQLKELCE
ncbi:MAG: oligoendopeptidase F [Clostridia bacterium]